jgi:hypothetical protein
LEHLANMSFMASFQAWTESLSSLSLWACILLPHPTQYLAVYYSRSGFTPNAFLLSGWLLTNVQVNIITMLHNICAHMYIHHIGITILLFFLHVFHSSWQAGWSRPFPSDTSRMQKTLYKQEDTKRHSVTVFIRHNVNQKNSFADNVTK